jgi:hypothetical protein
VAPAGASAENHSVAGLVAGGELSKSGSGVSTIRSLVGPVTGAGIRRSRRFRFVGGLAGAMVTQTAAKP